MDIAAGGAAYVGVNVVEAQLTPPEHKMVKPLVPHGSRAGAPARGSGAVAGL